MVCDDDCICTCCDSLNEELELSYSHNSNLIKENEVLAKKIDEIESEYNKIKNSLDSNTSDYYELNALNSRLKDDVRSERRSGWRLGFFVGIFIAVLVFAIQ